MNVESFGRALVTTGDLDPVYLMLNAGPQDPDTTARWCLAYWCYYHAGVASRIAEGSGQLFWDRMWAAYNEKWPRGTERRHFRGNAAISSLHYLQHHYPKPEDAVASLAGYATWDLLLWSTMIVPVSFASVSNCAQSWVGFGPWIAFKVADMLDCVIGVQVQFPQDASVWFDEPLKGAVWADAVHGVSPEVQEGWLMNKIARDAYFEESGPRARYQQANRAIARLMPLFRGLKGPDGRGVRIQELETILCKWKSHVNGRYEPGKDTREIIHGLEGWGDLAATLRKSLMERTPKEFYHG